VANSIIDPKDPDYCVHCGGECVADCAALEAQVVDCPTCGWPNYPSGTLGKVTHYTCRSCGIWYSFEEQSLQDVQDVIDKLTDEHLQNIARVLLEN
jgi:transcription elongation factor Elf1